MYLTAAEIAAVEAEARRWGVAGDAEAVVQQAFEAIFQGKADEAAYSVTGAAGIQWWTPEIWHKERPQVNAEQARALLAQGNKDGTHEGPIPEDDAKAISEANDLVEMAQTAWNQHVRGPEVEILLKMAANAEDGEPPQEEAEHTPQPPEPPPEQPEAGEAPEPEVPNGEPWEGYDQEKVSDIIAGIDAGAKEYSQDEFIALMSDVWNYETARPKGARKTILDHLEGVAKKLQAGEPLTAEEAADETTPQGAEPEQTEAPAEAAPDETPAPERDQDQPDEQPVPAAEEEAPVEAPEQPDEAPAEEEKPRRQRRRRERKPEEEKAEEQPPEDQEGGDEDYDQLIQKVEDDLERERLHKPKKPEEDIPDLPWDWTKMTDKELQRFYGIYAAVAYYKGYQLAREERIALHCKAAADELHNALLVRLDKYDEHGKEKKVALIEAEVESDENIKMWRRRQRKHETFAAAHRNERDSVGKLVEALSRHESMRHQEWERSGKLNRQK